MGIEIDALKCTGCMACEMVCGYHRDDAFAFLSSCIVPYRSMEKKDYFGVMLKEEEHLVIARPEKTERKKIGGAQDESQSGQGDSSAKPMLLREACDLCSDMKYGPMCVQFCPYDAISLQD